MRRWRGRLGVVGAWTAARDSLESVSQCTPHWTALYGIFFPGGGVEGITSRVDVQSTAKHVSRFSEACAVREVPAEVCVRASAPAGCQQRRARMFVKIGRGPCALPS